MSDGQKQKLKLLFFLASEPKVTILDEFTTSLDKKSMLESYQFLNDYISNNGGIIINITHNLSDIEHMPGSYFYIEDRNIIEIENKEILYDLYIKGR